MSDTPLPRAVIFTAKEPLEVATRGGPLTLEYSEAVRIAPGKGTVVRRRFSGGFVIGKVLIFTL